jgi:type II secretory pathway component PulF
MPEFAYIARDASGQRVIGTLTAASQRDVLTTLSAKSLFPVEVRAGSGGRAARGKRVKAQLVAATYGQLAALLRSGVPLLRSIAVLRDQSSHAGMKDVLSQVHGRVEEGETLADAMSRHPRAFGEMAINMIRAGGEGGFLEDALERVADFTEQQQELKSRTLGAVVYPAFLCVVGVTIVALLLVFFVPLFEPLFASLRDRGQLPLMTKLLLAVSGTLGGWVGLGLLVVILTAAVAAHASFQGEQGRLRRDRLKLRLPVAGAIFRNMAISRFCRVLGTMLTNGVPILRALQISSAAAGNRVLAVAIQQAAENISSGQSLAAPLGASGHFSPDMIEMIAVAEESNTLESVLTNMAESLERRTWRQLDLAVRLLEPIMLLMLAGAVLGVAVALLLPVMKMSQMLQ